MEKYQKIISRLKINKKVVLFGDEAIAKFKAEHSNYTIIKEKEGYLLASILVYSSIKYETLVVELIRSKYSIDSELAILRQKDTKPTEFAQYNSFVEACKAEAKRFVTERDGGNENE